MAQTSLQFIVNIDVPEIGRGVSFYEQALGLREVRRLFGGRVAEMAGGPAAVFLIEHAAGSAALPNTPAVRDYGRHWTPVHLDFVVADCDAAVARAVLAGAVADGEVRGFSWGRLATLSDPFGNGFCLLEFSDEGYAHAQ